MISVPWQGDVVEGQPDLMTQLSAGITRVLETQLPEIGHRNISVKTEQCMRGIRLGIVTSTFPFGSAEAFLRDELEALSELGCALTIFPAVPKSRHNAHPGLDADVLRLPLLAPSTFLRALVGLRKNARAAFSALGMILKSTSSLKTKVKNLMLFPTALAVANEACARNLEHIHAYWLSGPSTVAFIAARVARIGWSFSGHSWDIFLEDNLIAEKAKSAKFGRVISEMGRQGILRQLNGNNFGRIEVIHLGVALPGPVTTNIVPNSNRIRLLCPAFFYYFKDHTSLLVALKEVVDAGFDCQCVFAGDGPLRESIARKRQELGLEAVVSMPGMIRHEALLQQLKSGTYDAVVLASRDLEGIPMSLVEAMAVGIPCIATRTGAVEELINAECGVLVKEGDPQALADAIKSLASNPEWRKTLGEHSMRRVAEAFDAMTSARSLLNLMIHSQAKT